MRETTKSIIFTIVMWGIVFLAVLVIGLSVTGCGHNTGTFLMGTGCKIGFDSQNAIPSISYIDGFTATDVSRENSGWELEIDSVTGISKGADGSIKGIKKIRRFVGPQFNGYLVDIANENPELAKAYIEAVKAFWSRKDAGTRD